MSDGRRSACRSAHSFSASAHKTLDRYAPSHLLETISLQCSSARVYQTPLTPHVALSPAASVLVPSRVLCLCFVFLRGGHQLARPGDRTRKSANGDQLSWYHALPNTTPITPFCLMSFRSCILSVLWFQQLLTEPGRASDKLQIIRATSWRQDLSCKKESQLRRAQPGIFHSVELIWSTVLAFRRCGCRSLRH